MNSSIALVTCYVGNKLSNVEKGANSTTSSTSFAIDTSNV